MSEQAVAISQALATLPHDMIWWINDYVSDLEWQDKRKEKLKNLADEAVNEMADRAEEAHRWFSDGLSFTYMDLEVAMYEAEYGPSGDRGEYTVPSVRVMLRHHENAKVAWNDFVDRYDHLSHLLPEMKRESLLYHPL